MSDLRIANGHVLDPSQSQDGPADILILDGRVECIGPAAEVEQKAGDNVPVLDAAGKTVVPGLIDIHVHFREPGMEAQETIASGSASAAAGGFTSVCCMPNTDPALDSEADVSFVYREAEKAGLTNVFPMGAITDGRRGEELAEMGQMSDAGAVAFTDDGVAVPSAGLLRRAMAYARMLNRPIVEHCEDASLAGEGVMNEGYVSTALGLPGIPSEAEEVIVARDIAIAKLTGCHLHLQHLSTRGSIEMVRHAKAEGWPVSCEVTPHHLVLTDEDVRGYDPDFKVNPPLRCADDVKACIEGLQDGTIEVVASDHAPHLADAKELEFQYAPCGMIGLETSVGVLLTELVHTGVMTLSQLLPALTSAPSDLLRLNRGRLTVGSCADVTLIDPDLTWTVDPLRFASKSRNCPWEGRALRGAVTATVVGGRIVFQR